MIGLSLADPRLPQENGGQIAYCVFAITGYSRTHITGWYLDSAGVGAYGGQRTLHWSRVKSCVERSVMHYRLLVQQYSSPPLFNAQGLSGFQLGES